MEKPSNSADCCPNFDRLPSNVCCFVPQMVQEWEGLVRRHNRMLTKRKRLLELAKPRLFRTMRFVPKCPCRFQKSIEFVRDEPEHTRTTQLAFPPVRRLLILKERVADLYPQERKDIINRVLRYSLLSLYSRLANVQPPEKRIPKVKWTKKEWKEHKKYIRGLAKPKKAIKQPKLPSNWQPLESMSRYKRLAIPKMRIELTKPEWVLLPEVRNYKASDRVKELAKPTTHDDSALHQTLPVQIEPNALKFKATARIKELATPREKGVAESDLKENPFSISPNALKAKPSARIEELAEPKEYENKHIRENAFAISPAALKAKASPRIIELAKPKGG